MPEQELLQKIMELDFYIIDLHLYLNTHPDDADAIGMYNDAVLQNRDLRAEYTQKYGMLTSNHCVSAVPWQWIDSPWPWQKAANFELREENA